MGVFQCTVCGSYVLVNHHCGRPAKFLMNDVDRVRLSKLMSCLLRHCPEEVGLRLDNEGWVDIDELVHAIRSRWKRSDYSWVAKDHILAVAHLDEKGRFEVRDGRIRAKYGHSARLGISIGYTPDNDSKVLYHGTSRGALTSILRNGILPMYRTYVHLSTNFEDACRVGARHGEPVVVVIDADCVRKHGYEIYFATPVIRLVERVPSECIRGVMDCRDLLGRGAADRA